MATAYMGMDQTWVSSSLLKRSLSCCSRALPLSISTVSPYMKPEPVGGPPQGLYFERLRRHRDQPFAYCYSGLCRK